MQIFHLHPHPAVTTVKFKMKVLVVCLMAAALVGMVASTPFPKKTASLNKAGQMSLLPKVSTPKKVQERPGKSDTPI